uniref:AAA+ ATPase domain-containing protein n=1 Tax=viral metagenome TaxID=1070528 RepID=A0A6C0J9S8_9ZZZZ
MYSLKYKEIEYLHHYLSLLNNDVNNDLLILINVITSYSKVVTDIKKQITTYHNINCSTCSHCTQFITNEIKTKTGYIDVIPEDINYIPAITYLAGISTEQYIGLNKLSKCTNEIRDIYNMIAMDDIKSEFCKVLKYLSMAKSDGKMLHIGIYGPPGHGKTHIAQLLGKAFVKSGLLENDVFIKGTRNNMIGGYCGQTAMKTTSIFDEAQGGVLFLDEVYSFGNKEQDDVFTGECINTINQLLSERPDTLCIIAGYYKQTQESFFSYNPGLISRFPFSFHIKPYNAENLIQIFSKMANESGWKITNNGLVGDDLRPYVTSGQINNGGRDMEHILTKSIISHCQNNFLTNDSKQKVLSRIDIIDGLKNYILHKSGPKEKTPTPPPSPPHGMYT